MLLKNMHTTEYVSIGDVVEAPNGALAMVTSIDTSLKKPVGVMFCTGEFVEYEMHDIAVIFTYHED